MTEIVLNQIICQKNSDDLCRLCINLFQDKRISIWENFKEYSELFNFLQIYEYDQFSQIICSKCYSSMIGVVDLIVLWRKNQEHFQQSATTPNEEGIEEIADTPSAVLLKKPGKVKKPRNKLYTCDKCGKKVEAPSKLRRHMRTHLIYNFSQFICEFCKKEFPCEGKLQKHLKTHLPPELRERNHICSKCGKDYLDVASLRSHILLKHSSNVPKFNCRICDISFTRKNYRDYHEREVHLSDKPYQCQVPSCNFRTTRKFNLSRHISSHDLKSTRQLQSIMEEDIIIVQIENEKIY